MSQGESKGEGDQSQKEAATRAWRFILFGLIGATATTFAVGQLRRTVDWFYIQFSRSQSNSSWRNATHSSTNHGGHRDEARRRYNQRMQEEYDEERERMERIKRMQNVFNRKKNEYMRSRMSWKENDPGAYQHGPRTDTSFREEKTNHKFIPRHSGNCAISHYYSILGLDWSRPEPYSDAEIKRAFREKAMEYHPDQNQESKKEAAEAKFKEVMMAYEAIKLEKTNGGSSS